MTEHAVVIAGGGPTGLMLAGELALAGIDVVIVERRASQDVDGSRAGGRGGPYSRTWFPTGFHNPSGIDQAAALGATHFHVPIVP
jgi:3-(3-hydroxy-phenyl)propionate hydroxylase